MKANVENTRETDRNIETYRRVGLFNREIVAIHPDTGRPVVVARFYGNGGRETCCVWLHGGNGGRGYGKAGGGGYHKPSAALADALEDAGIALDEEISGRGDLVMEDAVRAVALAMTGKRKMFVHVSHA